MRYWFFPLKNGISIGDIEKFEQLDEVHFATGALE